MALLSRSTVQQVKTDSDKKKAETTKYDKRPVIPAGENVLTLMGVEVKNTKKTGAAMLVFEWVKDEKHKPLTEYMVIEGEGKVVEINQKKLVELFYNGFGYEFQEAETADDIIKQIVPFINKRVKAAIRHKEELYQTTDPVTGNSVMKIGRNPELWYVSTESDDSFYVNVNKTIKPLGLADKEAFIENNSKPEGEVFTKSTKEDPSDLPF